MTSLLDTNENVLMSHLKKMFCTLYVKGKIEVPKDVRNPELGLVFKLKVFEIKVFEFQICFPKFKVRSYI